MLTNVDNAWTNPPPLWSLVLTRILGNADTRQFQESVFCEGLED